MSEPLNVIVIVEGQTEARFVKEVLAPYWAQRGIYAFPTVVRTSPQQRGGDIRFDRLKVYIRNHLLQRTDTLVATFVDYYGLKEWPGKEKTPAHATPEQIADHLNKAARAEIARSYPDCDSDRRYFPFIAVHEFEALLFSDPTTLAKELGIDEAAIEKLLDECNGSPEQIDNHPATAPSKRLRAWNARYRKTLDGIRIAAQIGIDQMRERCPNFNKWMAAMEKNCQKPHPDEDT